MFLSFAISPPCRSSYHPFFYMDPSFFSKLTPFTIFFLLSPSTLTPYFLNVPTYSSSSSSPSLSPLSPTLSRHIKFFWTALEEMSAEEQSQVINFCSGRSRLPASATDFPMSFKLTAPPPRSKARPDDYLPIAQTCFFSLSIPEYTNLEVQLVLSVCVYECMYIYIYIYMCVCVCVYVCACVGVFCGYSLYSPPLPFQPFQHPIPCHHARCLFHSIVHLTQ